MSDVLISMMAYPFIVRATIVGLLVSVCASLLGTSLVLKRYSMIGDGLSHVGFMALSLSFALHTKPLTLAIPVCVLAAFLLLQINENSKIQGDAATALLCSISLAIGVMTVSLTTGMNTDVCNYMFGSILAMRKSDVILSIVLCSIVIVLFVVYYNRIFAITFDEAFASSNGVNTKRYKMILALLTSITVVLGMRMMGTLLISSLIVFPSLTAMQVTSTFKQTIIVSVLLSVVSFSIGLVFSYIKPVPTGACIVLVDTIIFLLFMLFARIKQKV